MPDETLEFQAIEVPPATPYADEPTETIPPGVYIVGARRRPSSPDEGPVISLRVECADPDLLARAGLNIEGDSDLATAHAVATALTRGAATLGEQN